MHAIFVHVHSFNSGNTIKSLLTFFVEWSRYIGILFVIVKCLLVTNKFDIWKKSRFRFTLIWMSTNVDCKNFRYSLWSIHPCNAIFITLIANSKHLIQKSDKKHYVEMHIWHLIELLEAMSKYPKTYESQFINENSEYFVQLH